jgi:hypothetical protein
MVAASAGVTSRVVSTIHPNAIRSSTPMLEVPGCDENTNVAKEVPVVSALKTMPRLKLDARKMGVPDAHAVTQ